jgi:hypothetical protein
MSFAYQQPLSDAIYILVTLILSAAGSLALYFDVGGVTSRLAATVAKQNTETPLRYLQTRSARDWGTPEKLLKMYRLMALATFCLVCLVLIADVVAIAVNGIR